MPAAEPARRAQVTAERVATRLDRVFDDLQAVAPVLSAVLESASVGRGDLASLDVALMDLVRRQAGTIDGAGVAFALGALRDAYTWLQWWRVGGSGELEFARHVFDPGSVRYYDYTAMPWFAVPASRGSTTSVGPYLDSGGTDRNIVTIGVPTVTRRGTCVVAADLRLDQLESVFRGALGPHAPAAVLVNEHGRVVASTSARHFAGSLLPVPVATRTRFVAVPSAEPRRLPWRVGLLAAG
ncbi:PDC sensor domain-containing protein [Spiractinospora alimapuensis]|uniref:cache domain-containing protein n=1 Tax=Spiractinospora alimapuensis TaxID=2820884 RepID=UPI001F457BE8|nr:cache domain-containing protein [Spiractinospora alimapuensis]QVQ50840.1 PDC sensor domain-containing protein [Spiractinospora alimapuensis]